jgi:hypothetical protein
VPAPLAGPAAALLSSLIEPATPSAVVFESRSASSALLSFAFVSLSSSLSPRLKGSFSATGEGSTADRGCHLPGLLLDRGCFVGIEDPEYRSSISSGGPLLNDTLLPPPPPAIGVDLNRSGLATGRGGFLGGAP